MVSVSAQDLKMSPPARNGKNGQWSAAGAGHGRMMVIAANGEANVLGIHNGMPLADALGHRP